MFCNPFYRDLTHYLMFPIMGQLMRYKKCLVIMGRDSATEDVKEWLEQGIFENVNTGSLWKVGVLENENPEIDEPDIGILKFSDLYNLRLQRNHSEFLSRVGFVFIVEPSRLLASGQAESAFWFIVLMKVKSRLCMLHATETVTGWLMHCLMY